MNNPDVVVGYIRTTYRTMDDLQKLRISIGNRLAGNFRVKLGMSTDGMSEEELEAHAKGILKRLRASHKRITDSIIKETQVKRLTRAIMEKRFKPDDLITEPAELYLMDNYIFTLNNEEQHVKDIKRLLEGLPIYDEFLSDIPGVGPSMAGMLVSEIDIYKAEYPSSVWKYAGLDVVRVFEVDIDGKITRFNFEQAQTLLGVQIREDGVYYKGVKCVERDIGRNRQNYSLVKREYKDKEGDILLRDSITYSPLLKTKLLGVLGASFLKASRVSVNGEVMNSTERLALAKTVDFDNTPFELDNEGQKEAVIAHLEARGYAIKQERSKYATAYYDYKERISKMDAHADKTKAHIHRMATRYAVKRFLVDLYTNWRRLENLPVASEYSEGVLGKVHGQAAAPGWNQRRA